MTRTGVVGVVAFVAGFCLGEAVVALLWLWHDEHAEQQQ